MGNRMIVYIMQLYCPEQIFVGIILLIVWSENFPRRKPRYQFLDLFAGKAQASKTWCGAHYALRCMSP